MDGQETKMTSLASIPRSQDGTWESCSLGLLTDITTESELRGVRREHATNHH